MALDAVAGVSSVTRQLEVMALHAFEMRHRVIANNIANIDSNGFQPLQLNFEEQLGPLRQAVQAGEPPERIAELAAQVRPSVEMAPTDTLLSAQSGENLDDQMAALTQNTLDYEAMLTVLSRLDGLSMIAATGGT